MKIKDFELNRIRENVWRLEKKGDMLAPGIIYGDKKTIKHLVLDVKKGKEWNALKQVRNVACLPGIQKASLAMPDIHPGYGYPIGGVGAFEAEEGVIAMGGIGFDVNCAVRTLKTNFVKSDLAEEKERLAEALFKNIPAGLGSTGKIKLDIDQIDEVLVRGAEWAVERGLGLERDLEYIEEQGCVPGAKPENVSKKAKRRQFKQIGTLGSGNHYCEVQYVDQIFDNEIAKKWGLAKDQVLISIHCGSRALGHQVGTDYLKKLGAASKKYGIPIREKELVCAPFKSPEGREYFSAVNCAINCAFANRQVLAHLTRKVFNSVFGTGEKEIKTLYEVAHNTAKLEQHQVGGEQKKLIVHRKGSTRAFGPGRKEIPEKYRETGQPVLVGGTMGTCSYILRGTKKGMEATFGSACHGAGRLMSRNKAKKKWWGETVIENLGKKGIVVKAHSKPGAAEEAPGAYKDVSRVVDIMDRTGISKKVVKLKPLITIKG